MSRYVEIPRRDMERRLEASGFKRVDGPGELCYERRHARDEAYAVVIWTSIPKYDTTSRECGADAIRVLARLSWTRQDEDVPRHKVIFKARVYRVGTVDSVLERTVQRAREAYGAINEELNCTKRVIA